MFNFVVLLCLHYTSALTIYTNVRFTPSSTLLILNNISQIGTLINCACSCFNDPMCLTAVYSNITEQCTLYAASLDHGILNIVPIDMMLSVLTFKNKTFSPLPLNSIDTVYGIWNTTTGQNSLYSTTGLSVGDYPPSENPSKAFDQSTFTKYVNFGVCNSTVGSTRTDCGQNTGLYITLQENTSLLIAFRFQTPNSYPKRDPMIITIEGSNRSSSLLNLGSSWTLIYNGSSGLDVDPGRYSAGETIWLSNNTIRYSSYRLLIQSKRGEGNFVQYSEFNLFII